MLVFTSTNFTSQIKFNQLCNMYSIFFSFQLTPLFVIVGGAVLGLFYAIVRNGLSRDDVRFYSSGKMNCEDIEKSGPRKFLVFNQKYKVPEGLKEALAAIEEPTEEEKIAATKKSK
ncbi:uncharacterized protein LOC118752092 [Rhagoletis pomonella]|uniref:uncharacterized protein LOC118752092 n=1 Tax=Rhagoletis pomonella TaxID=28610 RepID=UPI0017800D9C|nr:uncharacterized protein LOC118752092 [Rhagoletis pomonella]